MLGRLEDIDEAGPAHGPSSCLLRRAAPRRPRCSTCEDGERRRRVNSPPPNRLPIRCNATLVAGEPAAVVADAERWAADGFSCFKLKLGTGDDAAMVRAVREALGPRARIRVDANGAWDVETAKRTLGELEPYEVELAEQPVATMEEAAEVASATTIPLAADESVESRADAERAAAAGAFAMTGIKLSKVGGPEAAIEIAEVAPRLHDQRPRRSGRDRRGGAGGGDAGRGAPGRRSAPGPWPGHAASLRCRRRRGRLGAAGRPPPPPSRPWPRRRDRRGRHWRATAFSLCQALRAKWTRPTPTPLSPAPSSRSLPAAGCGRRSSPPARARLHSPWRSGGSRRSRRR